MTLPDTDHLIVGMSPFNPHFSVDWLTNVFMWSADHFATVDVLHPGSIAVSLLTATGTPDGRARRKVRQQCNRDMRTIAAALDRAGVPLGLGSPLLISDHINDPQYRFLRDLVADEYLGNAEFRSRCLDMSAAATESRLRAVGAPPGADLGVAVTYVLDELPAYTHCADLFNYPSAALTYPSPWPVGEYINAGMTALDTDPNSQFFVFDPEPEASYA